MYSWAGEHLSVNLGTTQASTIAIVTFWCSDRSRAAEGCLTWMGSLWEAEQALDFGWLSIEDSNFRI